MKNPVPYPGGKGRIAPRIAELLPEHRHYVEPFAGALSVLLAKRASPIETVNRHEYVSEDDHAALLAQLLALPCAVVLSGYSHPLYEEALAHWSRHSFRALSVASTRHEEVVWANRAAPGVLL